MYACPVNKHGQSGGGMRHDGGGVGENRMKY